MMEPGLQKKHGAQWSGFDVAKLDGLMGMINIKYLTKIIMHHCTTTILYIQNEHYMNIHPPNLDHTSAYSGSVYKLSVFFPFPVGQV